MEKKRMEELQSALKSINCPSEMDDRVLVKMSKKHRAFKPALVLVVILVMSVFASVLVNAEEIAKKIHELFITTYNENESGTDFSIKDSSLATINYDADIPECGAYLQDRCDVTYTKKELEGMLGIKLLSNSLYDMDKYNLDYSKKNNGKIATLEFKQAEDFTDDSSINPYKNTNIYKLSVALSTKYDKDFDGTLIIGGTHKYETYHINSIDEDAIVLKTPGQAISLYTIVFVHNDLVYRYEILFKSWTQNPDEVYPKFLECLFD